MFLNSRRVVCYNLLMAGPPTVKHRTLMYHDKRSSKHDLQVCKQQQTASGNKNLVKGVCGYNLLMVGSPTM